MPIEVDCVAPLRSSGPDRLIWFQPEAAMV
jgi:hypothetical protein